MRAWKLLVLLLTVVFAACAQSPPVVEQQPTAPSATPAATGPLQEAAFNLVRAPGLRVDATVYLGDPAHTGRWFLRSTTEVDTGSVNYRQTMLRRTPRSLGGSPVDRLEVRRAGTDVWVTGTKVEQTMGISGWVHMQSSIPSEGDTSASWNSGMSSLHNALLPLGLEVSSEQDVEGVRTYEGTFDAGLAERRLADADLSGRLVPGSEVWASHDGLPMSVTLTPTGVLSTRLVGEGGAEFAQLGLPDAQLTWDYSFTPTTESPAITPPDPSEVTEFTGQRLP